MAILILSSHFFSNYMNIFHKTEVKTIILRCWTGLNLIWFKSYDPNHKYFSFQVFCNFVKKTPLLCNVFCFFFIFGAFSFFCNCIITFEPIKIWDLSAPQNVRLNLSFVEDILVIERVVKCHISESQILVISL